LIEKSLFFTGLLNCKSSTYKIFHVLVAAVQQLPFSKFATAQCYSCVFLSLLHAAFSFLLCSGCCLYSYYCSR